MAKRFTDTALWDDPWYRALPLRYKLFWKFICNKADNAGVWKIDIEAASFFIGEKIDLKTAIGFFNDEKYRIHPLKGGSRWYIVDFIAFQYGKLTDTCPPHKKVMELLVAHGITLPFEYPTGYPSARVGNEPEKEAPASTAARFNSEAEFDRAWAKYPRRIGRKEAFRHFRASIKTEDDLRMFYLALDNYLALIKQQGTEVRYTKHGSSWFNNWRDYVDYKEPVSYTNFKSRFPEDKVISREGRGGTPQRIGQIPMMQQIEQWKKDIEAKGGFFRGTQQQTDQKENVQ